MGLTAVPDDEVAAVLTLLEMHPRPRLSPIPPTRLRLSALRDPPLDRYRALFARIGAPWLWRDRLALDDAGLAALVADPAVATYTVLDPGETEIGMMELDFRTAGCCEIAFMALDLEHAPGGVRHRWLMAETLARAWAKGVQRVRARVSTLDPPIALGFYRAQGFEPVGRAVETFADPRGSGLLPADSAAQIPYLASRR